MKTIYLVLVMLIVSCGHNQIRFKSTQSNLSQKLIKPAQTKIVDETNNILRPNEVALATSDTSMFGSEVFSQNSVSREKITIDKFITHSPTPTNFIEALPIAYSKNFEQNSGYHDDEAKSKFGTAITLLSLSIITLGFTYLIGLGVFISACVHYAKTRNKSKSTKVRFWIALTLVILMTAFFILAPIILFSGAGG